MPGNAAPSMPGNATESFTCQTSDGKKSLGVNIPVVPVFMVSNTPVATTVANDTVNRPNVGALPVGEAIFAHAGGSMNYVSSELGRLQRVNDLTMASTASTNILALSGMFDGPFAMPGQNLAAYFTSVSSFANVNYGTQHQETSARSFSHTTTIGLRDSLQITKSIGPGWDASISRSWESGEVDTTESITASSVTQQLQLDSTPEHKVVPNGTAFGGAMQMVADLYRFLVPDPNASGQYRVSPNTSQWSTMWAVPIGEQSISIAPYGVTPGDVTSYTEAAWNTKMLELGYPSWSYFKDVIVDNAFVFPEQNLPYLELPLAVSEGAGQSFDLTKSHFAESKWTFDDTVYAGISSGGGVSIFGVGFEVQLSLMAGIGVSIATDKSTSTGSGWGISVSDINFPSFKAVKGGPQVGAESFTARLYLLPAATRWTEELRSFRPELARTIDPHSEPWRVVYEVVSYTLTDKTQYPPRGCRRSRPRPRRRTSPRLGTLGHRVSGRRPER